MSTSTVIGGTVLRQYGYYHYFVVPASTVLLVPGPSSTKALFFQVQVLVLVLLLPASTSTSATPLVVQLYPDYSRYSVSTS
jgi:hypothetical protein